MIQTEVHEIPGEAESNSLKIQSLNVEDNQNVCK